MQNYKWISSQSLDTLTTPFPHDNREELEKALESRAMEMIQSSSVMDLLMTERILRAPERQRKKRRIERENQQDARFQIECKFRAWGYDSPEEMMANEPDVVAVMYGEESEESEEELRVDHERVTRDKAMRFARAILDLQHQVVKEKEAIFTTSKLDGLNRKVMHLLVETNNKIGDPMLPKLKSTTTVRNNYGKGNIEISLQ